MSKSLFFNLILTIIAVLVFIFIGAAVYEAFTRSPVNRNVETAGVNTVSGQVENATPDATQPADATPAAGTEPAATVEQNEQRANAAYNQTNDPNRTQPAPAERQANPATNANTASAGTPAPNASAPAGNANRTEGSNAGSANPPPRNNSAATPGSRPAQGANSANAVRSNPDLRSVIPPVPQAPPRAEGTRPPVTNDQQMYDATNAPNSQFEPQGSVSDSFPAPVSNFPAPTSPGAQPSPQGNFPGSIPAQPQSPGNGEQQRLEQLRQQKQQLRNDIGF